MKARINPLPTPVRRNASPLEKLKGPNALQDLIAAFKGGYRPSIKTLGELLRAMDHSLKDDPLYLFLDETPAVCAEAIKKAEWAASSEVGEPDNFWMQRQDKAINDVNSFASGPLVLDGERRGV